tara:strand:- start:19493 stop:19708 length:216 start_codon:yes stop_codon:yes gene_type:complete
VNVVGVDKNFAYGEVYDALRDFKVFVGSPEGSVVGKVVPLVSLDAYGSDGSEGGIYSAGLFTDRDVVDEGV